MSHTDPPTIQTLNYREPDTRGRVRYRRLGIRWVAAGMAAMALAQFAWFAWRLIPYYARPSFRYHSLLDGVLQLAEVSAVLVGFCLLRRGLSGRGSRLWFDTATIVLLSAVVLAQVILSLPWGFWELLRFELDYHFLLAVVFGLCRTASYALALPVCLSVVESRSRRVIGTAALVLLIIIWVAAYTTQAYHLFEELTGTDTTASDDSTPSWWFTLAVTKMCAEVLCGGALAMVLRGRLREIELS